MLRELNARTQPYNAQPVFNNWEVVSKGWYIALPSQDLRRGQARSLVLCGQRIVLFRGEDGAVRALDAFCPHMGTDLGIGKVVANELRCFFHHWRFDGQGRCAGIPCQDEPPSHARLQAYATDEKYGFIWVWPEAKGPEGGVLTHSELAGEPLVWSHGVPYERSCHHHVNMINGIDAQHLRTVHDIHIDMEVAIGEAADSGVIAFNLRGAIPGVNARERLAQRILGERYEYRMRYGHATIGCLTLLKNVRLFGTGPMLPELYMIFAYRPIEPGRTLVQPIYVARRRPGVLGALKSRALIGLTKRAFFALRDEDGQVYENIRFHPGALLNIDAPVAKFIAHVNRYEPSIWSKAAPPVSAEAPRDRVEVLAAELRGAVTEA